MPLYDYQCPKCQQITEVRHGFDDVHTEPCPRCASALMRVFNPAPILFKGSGFYVTDSRKSSAAAAAGKTADAKSDTQSDAKPDTTAPNKNDAKSDAKSPETAGSGSTPAPAAAPAAPTKESAA